MALEVLGQEQRAESLCLSWHSMAWYLPEWWFRSWLLFMGRVLLFQNLVSVNSKTMAVTRLCLRMKSPKSMDGDGKDLK